MTLPSIGPGRALDIGATIQPLAGETHPDGDMIFPASVIDARRSPELDSVIAGSA